MLLWIWRNHRDRKPYVWDHRRLFTSSCRLWAPLEKEVAFSKIESFNEEDRPLTPDDLKTVIEFAIWVQGETLSAIVDVDEDDEPIHLESSAFILHNADVGINRLYAHFDRRAEWKYHLYDFHEDRVSCSRSIYGEDRML
ncbi:hypothetical protein FRC00_004674 [Tulasnella sp. 408]|nr:hypothetical protein FRC00_004674 [Tulasnella sp. 408]